MVRKARRVTATSAFTPAKEHGRVQTRWLIVLVLMGPAVLLVGSALLIGSLFLPWYHTDPRYDHYPPDLQPVVPIQSHDGRTLGWFVWA